MNNKRLQGYVDPLLLKLYDKNGRILNDIKNEIVTIDTLFLAYRDGVLIEVLQLVDIINHHPEILTYIEGHRTEDYLYIGAVDLGMEAEDDTLQLDPLDIADFTGMLISYPFSKNSYASPNKYILKFFSEFGPKNKDIVTSLSAIPKEKMKGLLKPKSVSSDNSKQSNSLLKKSKKLIFVYAKYAILNLLNDVIIRASKNPETDIFTVMKNAVSPVQVFNTMIAEELLKSLEEVLKSKSALDNKDICEYFLSLYYKEDVKNSLKISGKYLYINLYQLISAYPIYTTPALTEQATIVASRLVSEQLENIVEYANNSPNSLEICETMNYINTVMNPEVTSLLNSQYNILQPMPTIYDTSFLLPQIKEGADILVPAALSLVLIKFVCKVDEFIKDKFCSTSKVKLLKDKKEYSMESLKETLNSLIGKEENEIKNKNISNLIKRLESLEGEDPSTQEYKNTFEKISAFAKAIVDKRSNTISHVK